MSKKPVILQLFVVALAVISVVVYTHLVGAKAASSSKEPPPEAVCLRERPIQLMKQRHKQRTPPLAVYFVPAEEFEKSDPLLAPEVLAEQNIHPATSLEALKQRVAQTPKPAVIYLHPEVFDRVDDDWLRQQYEAEMGIVALNPLVSQLGQKLNAASRMEDLKLAYRRGRAYVAVFFQASHGLATSKRVFADFVESPEFIVYEVVPGMVDTYTLTDEYKQQIRACLK